MEIIFSNSLTKDDGFFWFIWSALRTESPKKIILFFLKSISKTCFSVALVAKTILKNANITNAKVININGITEEVVNIVEYLNSFTSDNKITYHDKTLPIVDEILGNGPVDYFKNFSFTDLKTGLEKTISYYKNSSEV